LWSAAAIVTMIAAADQLAKWLVERNGDHLPAMLFDHVGLEIVHNSGASFSRFSGAGRLLTPVVAAVIVVILGLILRAPGRYVWPLAILLGGAAANLIDRMRFGYVVDFVSVSVWPTFNLADAAIAVGAIATGIMVVLAPGRRG